MERKKEPVAKNYTVRLTENALLNIDEITGFIAFINHQPLNATHIGDKIFATIDQIAQNPFVYRECDEIPTKTRMYRKAVCSSWLIVYKVKENEITILGIIHSSRKPASIKKMKRIR